MEPCLFRHGKLVGSIPFFSMSLLQWSHVFSDMVIGDVVRPLLRDDPTSMEPCLFRHGKGGRSELVYDGYRGTSMEPCLFRHGKALLRQVYDLQEWALQWSHVFSDMVSSFGSTPWTVAELLQWSHVFSDMVSRWPRLPPHPIGPYFNGAMSFQTW